MRLNYIARENKIIPKWGAQQQAINNTLLLLEITSFVLSEQFVISLFSTGREGYYINGFDIDIK